MFNFFKTILERLGLYQPLHCKVARRYCSELHPAWRIIETRTLAIERGQFIVAVFYKNPGIVSRPLPYQIYRVSHDCNEVTELPTDPESPYWILGRK